MMPDCHPYLLEFEAMWTLLRPHRPIAFGTRLARITGHPKHALLLSQLVYWTRRGRDVEANGGWIHKTREHWLLETGLSREEQENARRRLRENRLLREWRGGQPARLHYRLEVETIADAVRSNCLMVGQVPSSIEAMRADPFAGDALLGPVVAYRRIFVDLIGNVNAALLLSRMVQLQRREADRQCTWFTLTGSEWQRTLGLNRRQLENARARLVRQGLIREVMRQCTGRRVFTQVKAVELKRQLERLVSRGDMCERLATRKRLLAQSLREEDGHAAVAMPPAVTPGNTGNTWPEGVAVHVPHVQTTERPKSPTESPTGSPRLGARQDANVTVTMTRLAGLIRYRWRETCGPDARVYGRITYRTTTTASLAMPAGGWPTPVAVGVQAVSGQCGSRQSAAADDPGVLAWPDMVAAHDRSLIASHLARIPTADRQMLLDEMSAGHRHQPVQLPVAYIAGLVRRYLAGQFMVTRAHLERAVRSRAAHGEGAVMGQIVGEIADAITRTASPGDATGLHVSTRETACRHLAAIRDALRARSAHRPVHPSARDASCQAGCHA